MDGDQTAAGGSAVEKATADGKDVTQGRTTRRVHSPHRFNALADGVFAIAMTLLALEIRIPEGLGTTDRSGFQEALPELLGGFGLFALGFYVTSQYWVGHHRVMSYVHTVDNGAIERTLSALLGVAALPIAMSLVISWGQFPEAVALTSALLAATSLLSSRLYAHVLKPEFADIDAVTRRRIVVEPLLSTAIYLVTIPLTYAVYLLLHQSAAWAALLWVLFFVTGRIAGSIARRSVG
ncbi:TMEM175 family protein [Pseudonocardia sp. GCM10023141]|uniref:TMEM175 family protein n=1 Tax=Pseudonocardia sp. GCM10023141 TaxID=3252653 RepID=UPI00360AF110